MEDCLVVKERIQAGDVFLLKLSCPICGEDQLMAYPLGTTPCCSANLTEKELSIGHYRLLSGTKRSKGVVAKRVVQTLLAIQGPNCAYCLGAFSDTGYHVEHVIPVSVGGTNLLNNLCLACPRCNKLAGAKVFGTFAAKKKYVLSKR